MLYALGDPQSFAVLLVFAVGCLTLTGWITSEVAGRTGNRAVRQEGRLLPDPRRHLDPFGAVAAVISGYGWAKPVDVPRTSGPRVALVVLAGPIALLVLGLGTLTGFGAYYPDAGAGSFVEVIGGTVLLQEGVPTAPAGQEAWLLFGLAATWTGALSLVPLPPLPGGQVLFAAAPRTLGWQKAEHQLVERNIGTAVVLALMLIPLGSDVALLPNILDNLLGPLVEIVAGE